MCSNNLNNWSLNDWKKYSIAHWKSRMAKWEIHKRRGNPWDALWWRLMPGDTIVVPWPRGEITVTEGDPGWDWTLGAANQSFESADPNDHYRPWLERNVGRQGWDWNWAVDHIKIFDDVRWSDSLRIKFRRKHGDKAVIAALMWV